MTPILMAHRVGYFSWKDCMFRIEKAKEATARIVVYKDLGINNSYTMETSMLGPGKDEYGNVEHFKYKHFYELGRHLSIVGLTFAWTSVFNKKLMWTTNFLRNQTPAKVEKVIENLSKSRSEAAMFRKERIKQQREISLDVSRPKPIDLTISTRNSAVPSSPISPVG